MLLSPARLLLNKLCHHWFKGLSQPWCSASEKSSADVRSQRYIYLPSPSCFILIISRLSSESRETARYYGRDEETERYSAIPRSRESITAHSIPLS